MQSKSLTWAGPLYFLFYAAAAALSPFLVIFYKDMGLKGSQIGLLIGLPALISTVSGPVWGLFTDRTRKQKLTLLITFAGAILFALAISAFKSFLLLIPVVLLFAFFSSPISPLIDSTVMAELGGQKEKYGQYRMWATVGWGIIAPVTGWLIEIYNVKVSFWIYAVLMSVGLMIAMRIPVSGQIGSIPTGGFRRFLTDRRWLTFLIFTFAAGIALSMISNFLFIYLRDMGANERTLGLTLTFATLSEIPVFYFSNRLLKRWPPRRLMIASILLFAVRALAYTLISAPWMALVIQLLHGPTFSLMWTVGVSYADAISPPGLQSTAQGLFTGVMLGVGAAVGSILGGVVYEKVGMVSTFQVAALCALLGGVFLWIMESRNHEKTI